MQEETKFWQSTPFHLTVLALAALLFSLVPPLVSGLPFNRLLLSDAEFYAHSMHILNEGLTTEEAGIPVDSKAAGEKLVLSGIGAVATAFDWDLLSLSVYLSIAALLFYIVSVYFLCLVSIGHKGWSFFIAAVCIVEVHVLGGTTLGFRALGFLPRDLALGMSLWPLLLYIASVQQNRIRGIYTAFFICGLFANYYTICFVHLCAVMGLAEIIRVRKPSIHLVGYGAVFCIAAIPAIIDLLSKTNAWAPVDLEIMRMRNGFMIASPLGDAILRYLRRFIIHSFLALFSVAILYRYADTSLRQRLHPWFCLIASSFILSVVGIFVESQTEYLRFFLSRASLFFTLGTMILFVIALATLAKQWKVPIPNAMVVLAAGAVFLIQSNFFTVARYWKNLRSQRTEKVLFFKAVERLKEITPTDALILAPSPTVHDMAASLRTYGQRRIYVSYKDGGVSLVDGERARHWLNRYNEQEKVLNTQNSSLLRDFMIREGIDFAFLPEDYAVLKGLDETNNLQRVGGSKGFVIVKAKQGSKIKQNEE